MFVLYYKRIDSAEGSFAQLVLQLLVIHDYEFPWLRITGGWGQPCCLEACHYLLPLHRLIQKIPDTFSVSYYVQKIHNPVSPACFLAAKTNPSFAGRLCQDIITPVTL